MPKDQEDQKPFEPLTPAGSVEEVLGSIEKVIAFSTARPSRVGYFAALYKRITLAVQKAIADGEFQDGNRMERFDVTFANRYFEALNGHFDPGRAGEPTKTWQVSLDAAKLEEPVILQHLLGACNAHIALDLGITAHQIAAGDLPGLRGDFDTINDILAAETGDVVKRIDELSPVLADVHELLKEYEIDLIEDSLKLLRAGAWAFAADLAGQPDDASIIEKRDLETAWLGETIYHPGIPMAAIFDVIADAEQRDVVENIRVLDEIASDTIGKARG